jgi:hypothetical protein
MELRSENLTPLQRHLLTLLVKPRAGHGQPWLSLELCAVRVEPSAQVLRGRGAVVAARGLKATGWLRARAGGGLELALGPLEVAEVLDPTRRPARAVPDGRDAELLGIVERAVSSRLTFAPVAH